MTELKRPNLIPVGTQRLNNKKSKEEEKTVRFAVVLPESSEDNYPEYNYRDMLAGAEKKEQAKNSKSAATNGLDPLTDGDEDDVRRIADEMEAKYGTGTYQKRKRKFRKDDYADIGMGYDENDSFIDNTDGYDEVIPKNVTTVHGGFYINCGALEFKTVDVSSETESSSSSDDDTPTEKSSQRKRVLESSADSEGDTETDKSEKGKAENAAKKLKIAASKNEMQLALKKRLFSHEKIRQMKKGAEDKKRAATVKELLREKREDLNMSVPAELQSPEKPDEQKNAIVKDNKKPMSLANVEDVIESVVNAVKVDVSKIVDESSRDSVSSKDGANAQIVTYVPSEGESSRDGVAQKAELIEIVQLPENLQSDILELITKIKHAASITVEGKVKFIAGPAKPLLMDLERKCKCLGRQSRLKVYEHLAPFLKCKKETLMKRAKSFILEDDEKKIARLLLKLCSCIEKAMPELMDRYEQESKLILQRKFSKESLLSEQNKALRLPKRTFKWTDESKKILKEVVFLNKKCYILRGKKTAEKDKKKTFHEELEAFLQSEVQPLWPEGWMSMNTLKKVCNTLTEVKRPAGSDSSLSDKSIVLNSSAITITPVTTSANNVKPRNIQKSDISVSKVEDNSTVNKLNKALPSIEIIKTISDLPSEVSIKDPIKVEMKEEIKIEEIQVEEHLPVKSEEPIKKEEPEPLPEAKHTSSEIRPKQPSPVNHCQIIDLTDTPEQKRKAPVSKPKPKHYEEHERIQKDTDRLKTIKEKDGITGSVAFNQLITDSLSGLTKYAQNSPDTKTFNSNIRNSSTPNIEYLKAKPNEGDDIQKVMEGLKVLQKMSSPIKVRDFSTMSSSPVSVITCNKTFSTKPENSAQNSASTSAANHATNSFQEVFQRQFLNDFNLLKGSDPNQTPTTSKTSYNSNDKYSHVAGNKVNPALFAGEKYLQTSNNNYTQQNSNKLKSSQHSGPYNMLDDMFANLLNEYGYSKTANHKPNPQH